MTLPTIPHWWLTHRGAVDARPDLLARCDRFGMVDGPADWPSRVALWAMGAILAVGRGRPTPTGAGEGSVARWPEEAFPGPDAPALVVFPRRPGPALAYSARAVFQAVVAVSTFRLGSITGGDPESEFWNGWVETGEPGHLVPAPTSVRECRAYTDGRRTVYFHPRLLGPVWLQRPRSREWAPGLYVARDGENGRGLGFRGEVVPMGQYVAGRIRPIVPRGGLWG